MKHGILIAGLVVTLGAAVAFPAVIEAQGGPGGVHEHLKRHFHGGGKGCHLEHAIKALGLTKGQRQSVAGILDKRLDALCKGVEKVVVDHGGQFKAIGALPFDESAVRKASKAFAGSCEELAVLLGRVHGEVAAVLTPAQRAKAKAHHGSVLPAVKAHLPLARKAIEKWIAGQSGAKVK